MASKSFDKLIEEISNMTVLEVSEFVKALETKFGVSAAMPSAAAAPVAAAAEAPAAEEKSEYRVTLKNSGPDKIKSIKALRKVVPALGLGEAKKVVEEAPSVIGEAIAKAEAMKIKAELEAAGAVVELA